jgi:hypothetical protein
MGRTFVVVSWCAALLAASACSGPSSSSDTADVSSGIPLAGGSTLVFQDGGQLVAQRGTIEQIVKDTLEVVRSSIPLDGVTILVAAGNANLIPEIGFGGRSDAGTIWMTFDPSSPLMARSLESELFPLLAHEMHHVARFRTAGNSRNLLEAMVTEGLADRFSVEVAGIDPPLWSSALEGDSLEMWSQRARDEWFNGSYNHDAWFFGAAPPIPRWAGYTIGFDIVGEFLGANPSRRPSDLYAEPGNSFIPR